jgi:hypothetical protein
MGGKSFLYFSHLKASIDSGMYGVIFNRAIYNQFINKDFGN